MQMKEDIKVKRDMKPGNVEILTTTEVARRAGVQRQRCYYIINRLELKPVLTFGGRYGYNSNVVPVVAYYSSIAENFSKELNRMLKAIGQSPIVISQEHFFNK